MSNGIEDDTIARALFSFSAAIQHRVPASDWPTGWEWHMHPGTWNRILADTKMAQYLGHNYSRQPLSGPDDLLGCAVVVDAAMPLGAVELRFADQMMLPMGRATS